MASKIRDVIVMARRHEAKYHTMEREIVAKQALLHRSIRISADKKTNELLKFSYRYIEIVPYIIETAAECAKQTKVYNHIGPFINAAEQFFFMPLAEINHDQGSMAALLEEAYLAHRLIEEANNHMLEKTGIPLLPIDFTTANIIVHDIIGEPYANELDQIAIDFSMKMPCMTSFKATKEFAKQVILEKESGHWDKVWSNWTTYVKRNDVGLSLALNG